MHLKKVIIKNFRLLKDSSLDLRDNLSLLVGKNNTGKTSLLVLFEKFLYQPNTFHYNDFPISLRKQIDNLTEDTNINDLAIRMVLEIEYDENDDLENLSEFILDLDPTIKTVKILFECNINKKSLLKVISEDYAEGENKQKLIIKLLDKHLETKVYIFDDSKTKSIDEFLRIKRNELVPKELKYVHDLINLQIIPARRQVISSDDSGRNKPLSKITTDYFDSENEISNDDIRKVNELILQMDEKLEDTYEGFFKEFADFFKDFRRFTYSPLISCRGIKPVS